MEMYFAYGSNMNERQMTRRCPSARFVRNAILEGYRLDFVVRSDRWGGAVAGIISDSESKVEGVLYQLSGDDLDTLDAYENVNKGSYYRESIAIPGPDGTSVDAWVYFPNPDPHAPVIPPKRYLDTMIEGARAHGLSEDLVARLLCLRERCS